MSALDSDLTASAKAITEREMKIYAERTRRSQTATDRARKVMPAGVPSSFQAYDPWPTCSSSPRARWRSSGCWRRGIAWDGKP